MIVVLKRALLRRRYRGVPSFCRTERYAFTNAPVFGPCNKVATITTHRLFALVNGRDDSVRSGRHKLSSVLPGNTASPCDCASVRKLLLSHLFVGCFASNLSFGTPRLTIPGISAARADCFVSISIRTIMEFNPPGKRWSNLIRRQMLLK